MSPGGLATACGQLCCQRPALGAAAWRPATHQRTHPTPPLQVEALEGWAAMAEGSLLLVEALAGEGPLPPSNPLHKALEGSVVHSPGGQPYLVAPASQEGVDRLQVGRRPHPPIGFIMVSSVQNATSRVLTTVHLVSMIGTVSTQRRT